MIKFDKNKTSVMGILNVTPDSFSDGGQFNNITTAIEHAIEIEKNGASIIDIGAESTRINSIKIDAEEEIKRLSLVLSKINDVVKIPISVDTYKSKTALFAINNGADIINDIYGLTFDDDISKVIGEYKKGVCINHFYTKKYSDNVIEDIKLSFDWAINKSIKDGIDFNSIILDPGIGFGKTIDENWTIIKNLESFKNFNLPLLLGTSKKSLFKKLNLETPADRKYATITTSIIACQALYDFVRVHDVKENIEALKVANYIYRGYSE